MSFFLDTQETVQRFGSSIAEFRSLLDANHIRYGSPDDLFEFTRALENNRQFRMDLTALVRSIVKKEGGDLLLTDMMSIVAASVGGRSVADTTADITRPTNELMEFLLGTGCWKQFGSPSRPVSQPVPPPLRAPLTMEGHEPIPISLSTAPAKAAEAPAAFEDKASLLEISSELRRTLSRLESNTEQVKLHLDSIEQRIGKMASPPDAPPVNKTAGLEPLWHRGVAETPLPPSPSAEELSAMQTLPTRGRAVFAGRVPFDESPVLDEDDDFSSPTFDFDTEKKSGVVPVAIFIVLAAIAAAVFFYIHSARGSALWAHLQGDRSHLSSSPAPATPTPAATVPSTSASSPATDGTSPSLTGQSAAATTVDDGAGSDSSSDTKPTPDNPKMRYVAANIMEGRLLSAPRPEYPTQARMDHIEGQVVLQAIISRGGAVTGLHAIKGPESLRSAAVAAVRDWRYRPYSVDGHPEDVTTTVYVDFSLRPPPSIVQ